MSKTLKVTAIVLGIIIAVAAAGFIGFRIRYNKMTANVLAEYNKITKTNLAKIPDGVYEGSFKDFLVNVRVAVEIKKHRIKSVTIKEQFAGKGYEAPDTTERIVKAQNPKVDTVTGATGSSMGIMIAVNRALTKQE
ncbi:MAG: hypothetical protein CVU77_06340 [Elusimicrobia bacterium HGW-Elusimicrobia-1]|jgi:uncharacterized protein with FMN-binding domain|nr:MAG: hypothetical protein CVU77_06340 [Elusimicrobia bacterium HGW-Elusimicrobia-1]